MKVEKGTAAHDLLGIWALLWCYGPILAALATFGHWSNGWTYACAFVVVGGRIHALSILAHETWHGTLFAGRGANELIGRYAISFPVGMRFRMMREKHFQHHRMAGTLADPDRYYWDWRVENRAEFLVQLLVSASGLRFLVWSAKAMLGIGPPQRPPDQRPASPVFANGMEDRGEFVRLALVQLLILVAFGLTLGWTWYFGLWILPLISLSFVLSELRQFLEHARGGKLMVYRAGWLERFFLGCFNFHLHGFHHALASEPWFRIPEIEEAALSKEPEIVFAKSYFQELLCYLRGSASSSGSKVEPRLSLPSQQ